jgi:hypothetical protein
MIEELTKAAEAATPGPWKKYVRTSEDRGSSYGVGCAPPNHWIVPPLNINPADARFIALANPDTILKLIAAVDHYEAALLAAFPSGASGATAEHWNDARKELK